MNEHWKGAAGLIIAVGLFSLFVAQLTAGYERRSEMGLPPSPEFNSAQQVFQQNTRKWDAEERPTRVAQSIPAAR